jgi:hypothetical protein
VFDIIIIKHIMPFKLRLIKDFQKRIRQYEDKDDAQIQPVPSRDNYYK